MYKLIVDCKNRLKIDSKVIDDKNTKGGLDKKWGDLKQILDIN
jgi:hypothetical protein